MVTSPDQHKPGNLKAARTGAIVTALILISLIFGGSRSSGTTAMAIILAALLVLVVIVDGWLRHYGLRR